jgi:5'-3' exonuclease
MAKTFTSLVEPESTTSLVVDSLNLCFRYRTKNITNFVEDYVRTVESLKKSYKAGKVIILADWGKSSYRKSIFPEYKGNRELLRADQTPEE